MRGSAEPGLRFLSGAFDSRSIEPGECFFALRDQRDGHDFVPAAFEHGAGAAVIERLVPGLPDDAILIQVASPLHALRALAGSIRSEWPIPAIAITGSVGKTTTKEATAAALGARYRVLRTLASFNNEIGVPLTFLRQEPGHEVAVIELGFYVPGEIADLSKLVRQRIGIVTTIPDIPVHFARTPNIDAIVDGKAELIEALPEDGVAILNGDDPRVRAMAPRTRARVMLFGEGADCEIRATNLRDGGLSGTAFTVHAAGQTAEAHLPLPGRHLVSAALAALGAAVVLEVPLDEAVIGLESLERPAHRMSVRRKGDLTVIDDSYNSSPAAVHAALAVLRDVRGRRVAVLGDMLELGTGEAAEHSLIGVKASDQVAMIAFFGERMKIAHAQAAKKLKTNARHFTEIEPLVAWLKAELHSGDVVLVKGSRGMKLERVVEALTGSAGAGGWH